jgi:hypothetical protein
MMNPIRSASSGVDFVDKQDYKIKELKDWSPRRCVLQGTLRLNLLIL